MGPRYLGRSGPYHMLQQEELISDVDLALPLRLKVTCSKETSSPISVLTTL